MRLAVFGYAPKLFGTVDLVKHGSSGNIDQPHHGFVVALAGSGTFRQNFLDLFQIIC
jgi:hypothetical protein